MNTVSILLNKVLRNHLTVASQLFLHDLIAREIIAGNGFRFPFFSDRAAPTATQAPVYPYVLALCYSLLGVGSAAALLAYECFNSLLCLPAMLGLATGCGLKKVPCLLV